ncbi:MAG: FAD-dependent monooxygenase, partial [Vulcanimicrobiaceae bacterium]
VLEGLATANPYCDIRRGVEVTALTQSDRCASVTATSGSFSLSLRGAYVVGCDGAHGVSRHALGLCLEGMTYASRVVLSDDVIDRTFDERELARVALDRPGIIFAIRFAPNEWRTVATLPVEVPEDVALSAQAHRHRLERLFGNGVTAQTKWSSLFSIHRRHAQRFAVGRVALAGDAAHLNSPAGAQGMNAGMLDAANLAWKLAAIVHGHGDGGALFNSYDIERREMVNDTIERYTDRLTRIGISLSPRIKQLGIGLFSRALRGRGMQRKMCRALGMLSGRYTKSPIVDARHPLAGRRVDDVTLPNGLRLNRIRNGEAAMIAVGPRQIAAYRCIHVPNPPKRWNVKRPVALIVRPDGCVAAVITKPTATNIAIAWDRAFCGTIPPPLAAAM